MICNPAVGSYPLLGFSGPEVLFKICVAMKFVDDDDDDDGYHTSGKVSLPATSTMYQELSRSTGQRSRSQSDMT